MAFFADTGAVGQLWLFWVAPILGAIIGAAIWTYLLTDRIVSEAQGPDYRSPGLNIKG